MWELPKTDIVLHFPYANIFFWNGNSRMRVQ